MILTKNKAIEYINSLQDETILDIKQIKESRSLAQNRLYHKWISDLVGEFEKQGIFITTEDLHEGLRDKLIKGKYKRNLFTGKRKLHRKSTTELNKKDFSKYLEDVERYLLQTYNISHPLPTDIFYNN